MNEIKLHNSNIPVALAVGVACGTIKSREYVDERDVDVVKLTINKKEANQKRKPLAKIQKALDDIFIRYQAYLNQLDFKTLSKIKNSNMRYIMQAIPEKTTNLEVLGLSILSRIIKDKEHGLKFINPVFNIFEEVDYNAIVKMITIEFKLSEDTIHDMWDISGKVYERIKCA